ncbi:unnamed protein product, partial [Musa textilis]
HCFASPLSRNLFGFPNSPSLHPRPPTPSSRFVGSGFRLPSIALPFRVGVAQLFVFLFWRHQLGR